jgi:hypothetical protein
MQVLTDISKECKERAILLYKVFKLYFVETEKRWIDISKQMKEKITKYREISEIVLKQKFKNIDKIDEINSIMLDKNVNQGEMIFYTENLISHKNIINSLLQKLSKKREEIYLLSSKYEIIEKEAKLWLYDFDSIKCSSELKVYSL